MSTKLMHYIMYDYGNLLRTLFGQLKMSQFVIRHPHFRGSFVRSWDPASKFPD